MATILVVDDSELIRMLLKDFLEAEGHQVVEAADGGQGVALAASKTVDMAFVDIFMPGKEGLTTIKELKAARPGVPVVAISAGSTFTDTETLDWAKDYGADRAMPKPLDRALVLQAVAELLPRR